MIWHKIILIHNVPRLSSGESGVVGQVLTICIPGTRCEGPVANSWPPKRWIQVKEGRLWPGKYLKQWLSLPVFKLYPPLPSWHWADTLDKIRRVQGGMPVEWADTLGLWWRKTWQAPRTLTDLWKVPQTHDVTNILPTNTKWDWLNISSDSATLLMKLMDNNASNKPNYF